MRTCKRGHEMTPVTTAHSTTGAYCRVCARIRARITDHRKRGVELTWEEAETGSWRDRPPSHERGSERLTDWVARVYRQQHSKALDKDRPPTPDVLEVMANGGDCPPISHTQSPLDLFSADLECRHGRVPAEGCEHGCW